MDGFTLFGWAAAAGGGAILYLKLVSHAIAGVDHAIGMLNQTERAALRRRNAEKNQANPTTATVTLPSSSEADAPRSA